MKKILWWWKSSPTFLYLTWPQIWIPPTETLLLHFAVWRSACWGNFLAGYPWMHFLMKWEMCQLPLQMLKALGTSKADCNNMLHEAEGAMVVESPSSGVGTFQLNKGQGKIWPFTLTKLLWYLASILHGTWGLQNIPQNEKKKDSSIRGNWKFLVPRDADWHYYIAVISETWRSLSTKKYITLLLANSLIYIITDAFLQSVLFFCLKKFRL